jgi:hypothetical protein
VWLQRRRAFRSERLKEVGAQLCLGSEASSALLAEWLMVFRLLTASTTFSNVCCDLRVVVMCLEGFAIGCW